MRLRTAVVALIASAFALALHAQSFAYVGCRSSHTVAVADLATNSVVATIALPGQSTGVVLTPDLTKLYVVNTAHSISVVSTASNSVIADVAAGGVRTNIAVSPDGAHVYAPDYYGIDGHVVYVVDTATDTLAATIAMPPGAQPTDVAVSPDSTRLYISELNSGNIYVADTATNSIVDVFPFAGSCPDPFNCHYNWAVALSPDGTRLYSGSDAYGNMAVYDVATKAVLAVGVSPFSAIENIRVSPDGSKAFVFGIIDWPAYAVVDTATFAAFETDPADPHTYVDGAFSADSSIAYISDVNYNEVGLYDTTTHAKVAAIPMSPGNNFPTTIAIANNLGVPFAAFSVSRLNLGAKSFDLAASVTLGGTIDPATQPVTLGVASYQVTLPPHSFQRQGVSAHWKFDGTVAGHKVSMTIKQHGQSAKDVDVTASADVDLRGAPRPISVVLKIGLNRGSTSVP